MWCWSMKRGDRLKSRAPEKVSHTEDTRSFGLPNHPKGGSLRYNGDYGDDFLRWALPEFDYYLLSESDLAVNLPANR